ncbi:septum formation inhibitor [Serpentinimonas raichei]|uniref:Probable septum site-determining protein MinC n=1 Tax=Serpentinimonas raichei TaxID=1458425 RepID=A0A060NK54_9BURK|nr:septum site-determining protein MinC [Serpentinimonas raichei]BAO82057.1 septum formation inhibitor [Serpentinimonas raichei]
MPAASDPSTSFELKSTQWPLLALALRSADTQQLAHDWQQRYGDAEGFFEQDALLLDFSAIETVDQACDLPALLKLLRNANLQPLAYRGGSNALRLQAAAAGLARADDAIDTVQNRVPSKAQPPAASPVSAPADLSHAGALLIDRPLRSGQQVYARGRDLILMAMVNPGAEVVADGHIHVYAPLRGKAIAGARGDENARIFTSCLEAELLSIAGTYRTSEVPLPQSVQGKPAMVRLQRNGQGERLLIEPIA